MPPGDNLPFLLRIQFLAIRVFLTKATYRAIDKFAEDHKLTRSEAIRRFLKMELKSVQKAEM
jgi:metal-responsive CopG/Arc/MetJ family transcriptional regulator